MKNEISNRLLSMRDEEYKTFHSALMPTVDPDRIIGIRIPALRALAKSLRGSEEAARFLNTLPHFYYEENNLHGFLIEYIKDFDECTAAIDRFLPFVDNWATCDCVNPKALRSDLPRLLPKIKEWLASGDTYTVRFGIKCLMSFYLDEHYSIEYPALVAAVQSDEYYIKMMKAWYFATALAKQYEEILPFLEQKRLDTWVHNKTISKACDSYRITPEQKAYLRTLRRKATDG